MDTFNIGQTSNLFQNSLPPSLDLQYILEPAALILGPPIYFRTLYLHPWISNIFQNPLPPSLDLQYISEPSFSTFGPPIYSKSICLHSWTSKSYSILKHPIHTRTCILPICSSSFLNLQFVLNPSSV